MYRTSDFDYNLPESFIAQNPVTPRDSSKLMVFDTANNKVSHRNFHDILEYLNPGDHLVVNRSKVIPARIEFLINERRCEVFILKELKDGLFEAMVRPGKLFQIGTTFEVKGESGEIIDVMDDGTRIVRLSADIHKIGATPVPPYIKHFEGNPDQYQTVYAKEDGSVAAPTAGLHFTGDLIDKVREKGVLFDEVILHVGRGTFQPVKTEDLASHVMHSEFYSVSPESAASLNSSNGRIIATGTTSVRVLESTYNDCFSARSGDTDIFIYPGKYKWKVVDAMITNFHLPKSTLLMLLASFLENKGYSNSVEKVLELYETAKEENYRFYSFGDAMFIY